MSTQQIPMRFATLGCLLAAAFTSQSAPTAYSQTKQATAVQDARPSPSRNDAKAGTADAEPIRRFLQSLSLTGEPEQPSAATTATRKPATTPSSTSSPLDQPSPASSRVPSRPGRPASTTPPDPASMLMRGLTPQVCAGCGSPLIAGQCSGQPGASGKPNGAKPGLCQSGASGTSGQSTAKSASQQGSAGGQSASGQSDSGANGQPTPGQGGASRQGNGQSNGNAAQGSSLAGSGSTGAMSPATASQGQGQGSTGLAGTQSASSQSGSRFPGGNPHGGTSPNGNQAGGGQSGSQALGNAPLGSSFQPDPVFGGNPAGANPTSGTLAGAGTQRGSSSAGNSQRNAPAPASSVVDVIQGALDAGRMQPGPTGDVGNLADQLNGAMEIASRANQNMAAAADFFGNVPFDPNGRSGTFTDLFDQVHAGAAVGPGLRWKVVKPAGANPKATRSAVSLEAGETDDIDKGERAFQLDGGTLRSELVTGPENPLLIPPDVKSVAFVIDCSGSMAGDRFRRVAAAVSDAVNQMQPHQEFAVLLFNNLALQLEDMGLMRATDANKLLVADQLAQVLPVGGTDPTDALLIAVQMKPESIVVFSDGEFDPDIVHRVTRLNRTSKANIRISTVGISSPVSVLKTLANLNGPGTYLEVR